MRNAFCFLTIFFIGFSSFAQKPNLRISGSNSIYPLCKKLGERFMKRYPGWKLEVSGEGSEDGIMALYRGKAHIAMSSRYLARSEKQYMEHHNLHFSAAVIAYDALAVVVNNDNAVAKLTREEVKAIYTGKINNWKQLGGIDLPITVISRDSMSGTYDYFKSYVIDTNRMATNALYIHTSAEVIEQVKHNKAAIAFVSHGYIDSSIKAIGISYDFGKSYIPPTGTSILEHRYPIVRPLYLLYLASNTYKAKPFLDFVFTTEAQTLIKQAGYIPLE